MLVLKINASQCYSFQPGTATIDAPKTTAGKPKNKIRQPLKDTFLE